MPTPEYDVPPSPDQHVPSPDRELPSEAGSSTRGRTEMKIAAAALAAVASPPLGIAVAAGAALRSPDVRNVLRRATIQAVAAAIEVGDQINAVVARRAGTPERPTNPSETAAASPETAV